MEACKHKGEMNPFCLRCDVNASRQNSINLQTKCNTMDT